MLGGAPIGVIHRVQALVAERSTVLGAQNRNLLVSGAPSFGRTLNRYKLHFWRRESLLM
jgi:hypothetical protein